VTTMKAVCIRSFGGPEVLELTDIEMPQPADEEVLIGVRAASVNPVDYKIRSGSYPIVQQDQHVRAAGFMAHPDRAELIEIGRLIDEAGCIRTSAPCSS